MLGFNRLQSQSITSLHFRDQFRLHITVTVITAVACALWWKEMVVLLNVRIEMQKKKDDLHFFRITLSKMPIEAKC